MGNCFVASNRNELLGALELERAYDECVSARKVLQEWLEFKAPISKSEEDRKFAEKAKLILASPWEHVLDEESKLRRCLEALEGRNKEYGSPAASRAMIWRYLNIGDTPGYSRVYRTIEQIKALDDLRGATHWVPIKNSGWCCGGRWHVPSPAKTPPKRRLRKPSRPSRGGRRNSPQGFLQAVRVQICAKGSFSRDKVASTAVLMGEDCQPNDPAPARTRPPHRM